MRVRLTEQNKPRDFGPRSDNYNKYIMLAKLCILYQLLKICQGPPVFPLHLVDHVIMQHIRCVVIDSSNLQILVEFVLQTVRQFTGDGNAQLL